VEQKGVQVMVALDVSPSMLAQDVKPDRLSRAKMEIVELMDALGGDEVGLILFSGASFLQFPLTTDYATARSFVDAARPEAVSRQGTAIGEAIETALRSFNTRRASQKVLVLLTDGVNNTGEIDPLTAAEAARTLGIKVYTVGMGKTGRVPVPVVDAFGRQTITYRQSELDEETLRAIAEKTGGLYFRAEDTAGLQRIYADINRLEKSQIEIQHY